MKKPKEFCFIPIKCGCSCHQEIPLNPKRLHQYEKRGYPSYRQGHQHFGNNNVMKKPEVKAKITGRKRPDFSAYLRTLTGSKNPNFGNHSLFSQKHKERISEGLKKYYQKQILLEEKRKQQIRLHQLEVEKQEESEIKAKKDLIDKEFEAKIKSGEEKRVRFLPNGEKIEKQMNSTTLNWEPIIPVPVHTEVIQPKIEPIVEIPQSIPEIKPILSYDEQLKIALKRVQLNRENNLRQKKSEPIIESSGEDNTYSDRIKELVGKFGDPEKKEKHYIKPLWKVKAKVK